MTDVTEVVMLRAAVKQLRADKGALAARLEAAIKWIRDMIENDRIGWRGTAHFIDGVWIRPAQDEFMCEFCNAPANKDSSLIEHTAECLVTQARAMLKERP